MKTFFKVITIGMNVLVKIIQINVLLLFVENSYMEHKTASYRVSKACPINFD